MSTNLIQLTADIVSSHASGSQMSSEDLVQEIEKVFGTLKRLETGEATTETGEVLAAPAITLKKAFQKDQITCMICGRGGFKTLTRHLKQSHDLKPGEYRKQFNIPSSQSLTAKNYSEARRQAANENNLAANLEKARAVRAAKKAPEAAEQASAQVAVGTTKPPKTSKAPKPAKAAKPRKTLKPEPAVSTE